MNKFYIPLFAALLSLAACYPSKSISVVVSNNYNAEKNTTTYSKFPLGSIDIGGKWTKTSTDPVSRQEFFTNPDSVTVAVAINLCRQYSFYQAKMTENTFVNEYYEWDSKYIAEQIKGERIILKKDTVSQFIICRIHNEQDVNSYFLFGADKGKFFNLLITTEKWSEAQKVDFLETAYKNHQASACCN